MCVWDISHTLGHPQEKKKKSPNIRSHFTIITEIEKNKELSLYKKKMKLKKIK